MPGDHSSKVPFSPPRWLTPVNAAGSAVMLLSVSLALTIGVPLAMAVDSDAGAVVVMVTTPLLTLLLIALTFRAKTEGRAALRCALAPIAGIVNAGIIALCAASAASIPDHLTLVFCALGFGGAAGIGFGLLYVGPVAYAVHHRNHPSHDGADRVLVFGGAWTVFCSLPMVIAGATTGILFAVAPAVTVGVLVSALAMLGFGIWRLAARARWLADVRQGGNPNWEIVRAEPGDHTMSILPISGASNTCGEVLRPRIGDAGTAFRSNAIHAAAAFVR